jgi:hypothetical protein
MMATRPSSNNAGILRDRMLVYMSEEEWDIVIRVHLKGTFAPLHHAASYWRTQSKAGQPVDVRVINTTSHSAPFANLAAREPVRIGVTVNAIPPRANTRMTEGLREYTPGRLAVQS